VNNGPEDMDIFETEGEASAFHRDLTAALRHTDAPHGFTDRLMARALAGEQPRAIAQPTALEPTTDAQKPRGKVIAWPTVRAWVSGAVAAGVVAGLFAAETAVEHRRAHERQVTQATAEFQTAERITDHALEQAREQMAKAHVPLD
jgi:hypothetical protein